MKRKNIIIILTLVAIVAAGWYYFVFAKNKQKSIFWRTVSVERGNISVNITATGSLNAVTTVQVGTQVSGTIARLFADYNSLVKQGQIIALLDTTFLAAAKDDAEAGMQKSRAQLDQTNREFERAKQLLEQKVSPQTDFELALTNFETAKSGVKSAEAQLKRAKINLQYATIRAPINGTVISRNIDIGQTVIANFNTPTLFTIANDLKQMQVFANVDEADIGQVKINEKVSFTVDAYPDDVFNGVVKQIRLQPIIVQNVVTYIVIIDVPNPELKLMPGLTANVNINVQQRDSVLKVPNSALRFSPPKEYLSRNQFADSITNGRHITYLWIKKQENIYPEKVKTGISDGSFTEVENKIQEGDEVVTGIEEEKKPEATTTQKNPFIPQFPTRRRNQ